MYTLRVFLFGRLRIEDEKVLQVEMHEGKAQELLCYLLLHHGRPHFRETLATKLWHTSTQGKARRYLSKALWQLQSTLAAQTGFPLDSVLTVEPDWVQLDLTDQLWLDANEFRKAYHHKHDEPGQLLDPEDIEQLAGVVELYSGDLLEGCYKDWCLYERERFRHMHLVLLDKLMEYFEAHGKFETSASYGARILRHDQARERTHRRLMRLYYLAGDRTSALRQYVRCAAVLQQELNVVPAPRTSTLYRQIQAGQLITDENDQPPLSSSLDTTSSSRKEVLDYLEQIRLVSDITHNQIRETIKSISVILGN